MVIVSSDSIFVIFDVTIQIIKVQWQGGSVQRRRLFALERLIKHLLQTVQLIAQRFGQVAESVPSSITENSEPAIKCVFWRGPHIASKHFDRVLFLVDRHVKKLNH